MGFVRVDERTGNIDGSQTVIITNVLVPKLRQIPFDKHIGIEINHFVDRLWQQPSGQQSKISRMGDVVRDSKIRDFSFVRPQNMDCNRQVQQSLFETIPALLADPTIHQQDVEVISRFEIGRRRIKRDR